MNIQDLKSNTTWQEASNTINNNNNKISLAIATLENAKLKNKGYFTTLEKLNEAVPNPTIGSKAYVGTSEPYAIYIVENGVWVDSGYTGGDEIVANITTDRIEDGAVTSEKIATSAFDSTLSVSGKIAPADVVGEKINELEGKVSNIGGSTDAIIDLYAYPEYKGIIQSQSATSYTGNDGGKFAHKYIPVRHGESYKITPKNNKNFIAFVTAVGESPTTIDILVDTNIVMAVPDVTIDLIVPEGAMYMCVNTKTFTTELLDIAPRVIRKGFEGILPKMQEDINKLYEPITEERTSFFKKNESVNLYNKEKQVEGLNLKGYWNGRFVANDLYTITAPIYLESGKTYKSPYDNNRFGTNVKLAKVEENGAYISMADASQGSVTDGYLTYTPSESGFYSFNLGYIDSAIFMVCEADKYPEQYVPYSAPFFDIPSIKEARLKDIDDKLKSFVPDIKPLLYQKVIVFDGDSICYGVRDDSGKHGWASRICEDNNISYDGKNYAVSGGTIATETYNGSNPRHWISASIETIIAEHEHIDYLVLEGGTNDADILGDEGLGTFDEFDFSGNYESNTFLGGLETLFYKAINAYRSSKIAYIIAPKMSARTAKVGANTKRRERFFEEAKKICAKWGIPFIDLWHGSHLNPYMDSQYHNFVELSSEENAQANINRKSYYADGQHPTSYGYDVIAPIIERWLESL